MLPEGLTLDLNEYGLCITDAQDVVWVSFRSPSHCIDVEDPFEWFCTVVESTCESLGVTEGFDMLSGDGMAVGALIYRAWREASDVHNSL